MKVNNLIVYREIIGVCPENRTKHINKLCVQNVELLDAKPVGIQRNNSDSKV
jgi:hypothetical protein